MPDLISLTLIFTILKIVGGVSTFLGLTFGLFKVISWIKTKFTSIDDNVVKLTTSMDAHISGLRDDIKQQTSTLATELREQRQDFRTFYAPALMQQLLASSVSTPASPTRVAVRAKRTRQKKKTK